MANGPTGQPPTQPQPGAPAPASASPAAQPRGSVPGVTVRTIRDPQYGHWVDVHELPQQTPGLVPQSNAAAHAGTTRPDSVQSP